MSDQGAYLADWHRRNPHKAREYREHRKRKVIDAYGGVCSDCGEADIIFLTIDHLDGGGKQDRGGSSTEFYKRLVRESFPPGFAVRCFNHNYRRWSVATSSAAQDTRYNRRRRRIRSEVIAHYGGMCGCCGEVDPVVLTIDHIAGDGKVHRLSLPGGHALYAWLRRHGYPPGFQLLCFNCNSAKGQEIACPHQRAA